MGFNQLQLLSFVKFKLFYFWPMRVSSCWLLGPFDSTLVVFDNFLAFWYDEIFQAHFVQFSPQTWKEPFLQKSLISFSEKLYFKITVWVLELIINGGDSSRDRGITNGDLMNSNDTFNSHSVLLISPKTLHLLSSTVKNPNSQGHKE